jgi:hypothetical protein
MARHQFVREGEGVLDDPSDAFDTLSTQFSLSEMVGCSVDQVTVPIREALGPCGPEHPSDRAAGEVAPLPGVPAQTMGESLGRVAKPMVEGMKVPVLRLFTQGPR